MKTSLKQAMSQGENQFALMETDQAGRLIHLVSTHASYEDAVRAKLGYYRPGVRIVRRRKGA
uniref:Uncharacterized protein n=1 Tax=viral metagenome TaxID=1070528 RepID=A0A6H1ZRJ0_9ZZZZ